LSNAYFYAQIDANNVVIGISQLSGEVTADHMIPIDSYDLSLIGKVRQADGTFVKPEPPAPTLEDIKKSKLAELQAARDAAIYTSFQSSALGSPKTYNYNREAYENFRGEAILLNLDPTIDTVLWATVEDGFVTHTRAQFVQVLKDGAAHEKNVKMKYYQLEAQVNAATTIDEVNAITW
jgi:hypothetical protein